MKIVLMNDDDRSTCKYNSVQIQDLKGKSGIVISTWCLSFTRNNWSGIGAQIRQEVVRVVSEAQSYIVVQKHILMLYYNTLLAVPTDIHWAVSCRNL